MVAWSSRSLEGAPRSTARTSPAIEQGPNLPGVELHDLEGNVIELHEPEARAVFVSRRTA
jgi:hypothetical protein